MNQFAAMAPRLHAQPGIIIPMPDAVFPAPTPFVWKDPAQIPPRPWTYGTHLQRKTFSVTVAPGAAGKTTLTMAELLCMATGREFMGDTVPERLTVWGMYLEEPRDELDRRVSAAMLHHGISPAEVNGRLYLDASDTKLCIAEKGNNGYEINSPVVDKIIEHVNAHRIDHITVDPFVKTHRIGESDNVDTQVVADQWLRIALECNISIELVHHTRKGNGNTLSTEDARGASGLLYAARDGRVLNKASSTLKAEMGVSDDKGTYFSVTQDKPNMSTGSGARWFRTVGVDLGNGDWVAASEPFTPPDAFDGISPQDTLAVQNAIEGLEDPRHNAQAKNWVGITVAQVLGLDAEKDKLRIKRIIETWIGTDVLRKEQRDIGNAKSAPMVVVGKWITVMDA